MWVWVWGACSDYRLISVSFHSSGHSTGATGFGFSLFLHHYSSLSLSDDLRETHARCEQRIPTSINNAAFILTSSLVSAEKPLLSRTLLCCNCSLQGYWRFNRNSIIYSFLQEFLSCQAVKMTEKHHKSSWYDCSFFWGQIWTLNIRDLSSTTERKNNDCKLSSVSHTIHRMTSEKTMNYCCHTFSLTLYWCFSTRDNKYVLFWHEISGWDQTKVLKKRKNNICIYIYCTVTTTCQKKQYSFIHF